MGSCLPRAGCRPRGRRAPVAGGRGWGAVPQRLAGQPEASAQQPRFGVRLSSKALDCLQQLTGDPTLTQSCAREVVAHTHIYHTLTKCRHTLPAPDLAQRPAKAICHLSVVLRQPLRRHAPRQVDALWQCGRAAGRASMDGRRHRSTDNSARIAHRSKNEALATPQDHATSSPACRQEAGLECTAQAPGRSPAGSKHGWQQGA